MLGFTLTAVLVFCSAQPRRAYVCLGKNKVLVLSSAALPLLPNVTPGQTKLQVLGWGITASHALEQLSLLGFLGVDADLEGYPQSQFT